MGTRAAFWKGDPRDFATRQWLGCICFDGYPEGVPDIMNAKSEEDFLSAVYELAKNTRRFASPDGGWPFPWDDDIFLTDYTYAWFDDRLNVSLFHHGFKTADDITKEDFAWPEVNDPSCLKVQASNGYDPSQPDSIIIVSI